MRTLIVAAALALLPAAAQADELSTGALFSVFTNKCQAQFLSLSKAAQELMIVEIGNAADQYGKIAVARAKAAIEPRVNDGDLSCEKIRASWQRSTDAELAARRGRP